MILTNANLTNLQVENCEFLDSKNTNLKRNFIFTNDIKLFFTYFSLFMKKIRKLFSVFRSYMKFEETTDKMDKIKIGFVQKLKPNFFFIAGINDRDTCFFNLFKSFVDYYVKEAFFIAWDPSRFFYFLRKKKRANLNFFPIIIVSPNLYYNSEFMHALKALRMYPIIFFFDRKLLLSQQIFNYKNVFAVFITKKNNLSFIFSFFKLFFNSF